MRLLTVLLTIGVITGVTMGFSIATVSLADAQTNSLSGKKGDVRRRLPRGHGDCPDSVKGYIDASGHSAYAQTALDFSSGRGYICASALNRRSQAEAEALALRACEAGTKKWSRAYSGKCEIFASK